MLKDNIKVLRKLNGLSQEELSIKLNVVRQTVSKWEQGLSVPDSQMLMNLSKIFNVPVSKLLDESYEIDTNENINEKLDAINNELIRRKERKNKIIICSLLFLIISIVLILLLLVLLNSPYIKWNYNDIETSILGTLFHSFEWIFIRCAPIALFILIIAIVLIKKNNQL